MIIKRRFRAAGVLVRSLLADPKTADLALALRFVDRMAATHDALTGLGRDFLLSLAGAGGRSGEGKPGVEAVGAARLGVARLEGGDEVARDTLEAAVDASVSVFSVDDFQPPFVAVSGSLFRTALNGTPVGIKVLDRGTWDLASIRVLLEASSHPRFVDVFGLVALANSDAMLGLVVEWIDGVSIHHLAAAGGSVSALAVALADAAAALEHLAARGYAAPAVDILISAAGAGGKAFPCAIASLSAFASVETLMRMAEAVLPPEVARVARHVSGESLQRFSACMRVVAGHPSVCPESVAVAIDGVGSVGQSNTIALLGDALSAVGAAGQAATATTLLEMMRADCVDPGALQAALGGAAVVAARAGNVAVLDALISADELTGGAGVAGQAILAAIEGGSMPALATLLDLVPLASLASAGNDFKKPRPALLVRAVKLDRFAMLLALIGWLEPAADRALLTWALKARDPDGGETPLIAAAMANRGLDRVAALVKAGADVNAALDQDGTTALWHAARGGNLAVVKALVGAGADVGAAKTTGSSVLWAASLDGHAPVVAYLLEQGADHERPNNDGASPLFAAAQGGGLDVVVLLLDRGANPEASLTNDGSTPLFVAGQKDHVDIIAAMAERGADVNAVRFGDGATPICLAAQLGRPRAVAALLAAGADPSASRKGIPAIVAAAGSGSVRAVCHFLDVDESLVAARVPPGPHGGTTALHQGLLADCRLLVFFSHFLRANAFVCSLGGKGGMRGVWK